MHGSPEMAFGQLCFERSADSRQRFEHVRVTAWCTNKDTCMFTMTWFRSCALCFGSHVVWNSAASVFLFLPHTMAAAPD